MLLNDFEKNTLLCEKNCLDYEQTVSIIFWANFAFACVDFSLFWPISARKPEQPLTLTNFIFLEVEISPPRKNVLPDQISLARKKKLVRNKFFLGKKLSR